MKRFENYLKLNGLYVGSKSIFELEDAPQDTPIWIRTWIGTTYVFTFFKTPLIIIVRIGSCDPFYIAKSSHPSCKPLSFASATQMRAAVNYGFTRDPRRSSTWSYNRQTEKWTGNPVQCVQLSRYIRGLHNRKTRSGECATSSRAATASIMRKLHASLLAWLENNSDNANQRSTSCGNKKNIKDWGGRLKRFSTWLIGLIAFRCLLRTCDVVDLTVENLGFSPLEDDDTHISITPWWTKTQQAGSVEPFHFYSEYFENLVDFCIVRGIRAWLRMSGITQGYLFPKIYGYDQLQDSMGDHMSTQDFLSNFRNALKDIGESPEMYTVHAFRRGGTQFLYEDVKMNLIKILQWGKWSTDLTYSTILRYLIADTDIMKTPRSRLMLPNRGPSSCRSCRRSCLC
ncbi:hypothetical protein F5879DRAFT_811886 [Lentinula edodes]|nr:hypothetical protein F5879DRAFT_811886 [Lentinula edodes]